MLVNTYHARVWARVRVRACFVNEFCRVMFTLANPSPLAFKTCDWVRVGVSVRVRFWS